MTHPALHELYLEYLVPQIQFEHGSFRDLIYLMYEKEFVWTVFNDNNRKEDGLDIRREWAQHFEEATGTVVELDTPCSFLEVLIGLSRRMEFMAGEDPGGWAWQLLINLEMHRMRDPLSRYKARKADDIMDTVIFRTYDRDGTGGFFPLNKPKDDQRKVELWYQMNDYIEEIQPVSEY